MAVYRPKAHLHWEMLPAGGCKPLGLKESRMVAEGFNSLISPSNGTVSQLAEDGGSDPLR